MRCGANEEKEERMAALMVISRPTRRSSCCWTSSIWPPMSFGLLRRRSSRIDACRSWTSRSNGIQLCMSTNISPCGFNGVCRKALLLSTPWGTSTSTSTPRPPWCGKWKAIFKTLIWNVFVTVFLSWLDSCFHQKWRNYHNIISKNGHALGYLSWNPLMFIHRRPFVNQIYSEHVKFEVDHFS